MCVLSGSKMVCAAGRATGSDQKRAIREEIFLPLTSIISSHEKKVTKTNIFNI
jgi:hypothetical protein